MVNAVFVQVDLRGRDDPLVFESPPGSCNLQVSDNAQEFVVYEKRKDGITRIHKFPRPNVLHFEYVGIS